MVGRMGREVLRFGTCQVFRSSESARDGMMDVYSCGSGRASERTSCDEDYGRVVLRVNVWFSETNFCVERVVPR